MASTFRLPPADREFFAQVARAAACNPFSEERAKIDEQILGSFTSIPPFERLHRLTQVVGARVRKLNDRGAADLRLYEGEEREIVRGALLFDLYHRYREPFDDLIVEQVRAGDPPVTVPFARDALGSMKACGFDGDDALRLIAIMYQIRRAYYFIDNGLIGDSPCMQELRRRLWNNVFTHDTRRYELHLWNRMEDFSTLLLGETGTGKGTAAAAIGRSGFIPFDERRGCFVESFTSNFIALNLSQYPETLIESEVFGHRKGAFTGAVEAHDGVLSRCSPHGAILLDEIGEVSAPVQIKLLQVLQERTFSPVGSHEKRRFHGRVIAATNKPLHRLRGEGQFRDDFFYRLCSDVITVPTLRQRIAEDPAELDRLVSSVVARLSGHESDELTSWVRGRLVTGVGRDYPWPGNVRELEQAVRRVLLTQNYEGDHRAAAPGLRETLTQGLEVGTLTADELLSGYCRLLYERHGTYEEVARRTRLDRRTVKTYVTRRGSGASQGQ